MTRAPNGAGPPDSLSVPQDAKSNPSNGLVERVARIVDPWAYDPDNLTRSKQRERAYARQGYALSKAREIHALYQQEGVLSSQRGENRSANAISGPTLHGADTEAVGSAEKKAFLAGWWVNAAEPDKDGAASRAYFEACAEVDWRDFAADTEAAGSGAAWKTLPGCEMAALCRDERRCVSGCQVAPS